MTTRDQRICKAILDVLHDLDGGQIGEVSLHAEVNALIACSLAEFNSALALCNTSGWLTGVAARFNKRIMKWNINDAGEAARLEINV